MSITILIGAQRLLQQKTFSSRTQRLQILIKVNFEEKNEWNMLFTKYFECLLSAKQDFFVFMFLSTSILSSQQSCLTFTLRTFFLQEKKTKSHLSRGALSEHAKFEVAYKSYNGYLVRSAKHNFWIEHSSLFWEILPKVQWVSVLFPTKKDSTDNSSKKSKMTKRCEQTIPISFQNSEIVSVVKELSHKQFCHH